MALRVHLIVTLLLSSLWMWNGLVCKVIGIVPRHELIVARILGDGIARPMTILIGLLEVGLSLWILSGKWSRVCAILQMIAIATMNVLEFVLVPDLLLWGRLNVVFAFMLVALIYVHEFRMRPSHAVEP